MADILAVNPAIPANTGMDKGALVTVMALTAAMATLLMAWWTNYSVALAPGMGINASFTFTTCQGRGVPWLEALGMVFVNGVVFVLLSVTGVREKIVAAIPHALRIAVTGRWQARAGGRPRLPPAPPRASARRAAAQSVRPE